jgi:hypothetical protein
MGTQHRRCHDSVTVPKTTRAANRAEQGRRSTTGRRACHYGKSHGPCRQSRGPRRRKNVHRTNDASKKLVVGGRDNARSEGPHDRCITTVKATQRPADVSPLKNTAKSVPAKRKQTEQKKHPSIAEHESFTATDGVSAITRGHSQGNRPIEKTPAEPTTSPGEEASVGGRKARSHGRKKCDHAGKLLNRERPQRADGERTKASRPTP